MEHSAPAVIGSQSPSSLSVWRKNIPHGPIADSPKKTTVCRFLPLPSISASPISTPTTSISPPAQPLSPHGSSQYNSLLTRSSPPTWISTPPTPPPKSLRRSITCLTRPASEFPPSASFPPSAPLHGTVILKRRASLPPLSLHPSPPYAASSTERTRGRESCSNTTLCTTASSQSTLIAPPNNASNPEAMRRRPLFHIPCDPSPDSETSSSPSMAASPEPIHEPEWSLNHANFDRVWHIEKVKDDLRKYHTLKELLSTEVGYLRDLRALVTVYLRILPTLTYRPPTSFGRPSSSFTSGPWINSYSYSHSYTASLPSSTSFSDSSVTSYANMKDSTKTVSRYLFTDDQVEVLTRNAEEVLQLHEHFVQELRAEVAPLGFCMEAKSVGALEEPHIRAIQNIDHAIRAVSAKFATEASRFAAYGAFCAGHPEALDLVRKSQTQRPLEWQAFEQRCSSLIHELGLTPAGDLEPPEPTGFSEESDAVIPSPATTKKRNRAASLSSIDGSGRTMRPRDKGAKLALDDYLIKPIQRICKYPMMLDQLRQSKSIQMSSGICIPSDVDVVVESATQAMRHVARAVDEARHRQDVAVRSSLIISRMSLANPSVTQTPHSIPQSLTPRFLTSLGTCILAGSLDVIHYHAAKPTSVNVTAKYLGAFLYLGGYLILVKVLRGKVYEPKHWFSLADFDVCGLEEDDAMLSSSFRLTSKEHQFELAAACQREKDTWLGAIQQSREHEPCWVNEPNSSLPVDGKGDLIPSALEDGPFEIFNALPTIQSIPELLNHPEAQLTFSAFSPELKQTKSPRSEFAPWRQESEPPSRRSSTASVKAIFSPTPYDSETIVIRRSSASARSRVDLGLQDVISQSCLTARSYASSRDEELFQAPKSTRSGFVRSQSGITMAGRLTRHESVRITRRRSFVDGSDKFLTRKSTSAGQSASNRRRMSAGLSITPLPASEGRPSISRPSISPPRSPTSPSPYTPATMKSSIMVGSPSHSPTLLEAGGSGSSSDVQPPLKSSRSLVSNVKEFFSSRSSSIGTVSKSSELLGAEPYTTKMWTPIIGNWASASLHRRTRSVPSNDGDESPFTLPNIETFPALDFGAPILTPSLDHESNMQPISGLPNHRPPVRKSRFPLCASSVEMDSRHNIPKNISFLQRLKA